MTLKTELRNQLYSRDGKTLITQAESFSNGYTLFTLIPQIKPREYIYPVSLNRPTRNNFIDFRHYKNSLLQRDDRLLLVLGLVFPFSFLLLLISFPFVWIIRFLRLLN